VRTSSTVLALPDAPTTHSEISRAARPCCSTEAAASDENTLILTCLVTARIESITLLDDQLHGPKLAAVSSAAAALCADSDFTAAATTEKPLPAAPARATSIVAFSEKSLIYTAMC
jgi:hypothetical protein